jgi:hypothetical protein
MRPLKNGAICRRLMQQNERATGGVIFSGFLTVPDVWWDGMICQRQEKFMGGEVKEANNRP